MDNEVFSRLLAKIKTAYDSSDIKKYCEKNGHQWAYELCATKITNNKPLIIGFNWGAASDGDYPPQKDYPTATFDDLFRKKDLGSFSRVVPYCNQYISPSFIHEAGQSNFCFFRSQRADQITERDLDLCKPIFKEFLESITPSLLLCFSSKLRDYLIDSHLTTNLHSKELTDNVVGGRERTYKVAKGDYIAGQKLKTYFLPHPNYRIQQTTRDKAWEFCFRDN